MSIVLKDYEVRIDVLCFSEHWLCNDEIPYTKIHGYSVATSFCRNKGQHGGVAIMVKEKFSYIVISEISLMSVPYQCELCGIKVRNAEIVVVSVYRPPSGDLNVFYRVLNMLFDFINVIKTNIILCGDFNIHFNANSRIVTECRDFFTSYGLQILLNEPTREQNCIDNVITNLDRQLFCFALEDVHLSDHRAVIASFQNQRSADDVSPRTQIIRPFTSAGIYLLFHEVSNLSWDFVECTSINVNQKFNILTDILSGLICQVFPEKAVGSTRKSQPIRWFTPALRLLRENMVLSYQLYKQFPNNTFIANNYKQLKAAYRKEILAAKKRSNDNFIKSSQNKAKNMWTIVNQKRNKANVQAPISENLSPDDLNTYFTNIARELVLKLDQNKTDSNKIVVKERPNLSFIFTEISIIHMRDILTSLKNNTSRDIYSMNVNLLKAIRDPILLPLCRLINQCIRDCVFPDVLKIARVIPLLKSGDCEQLSNYRPISIIPIIAKVFEKLLFKQLFDYFNEKKIFTNSQFGFRKGRSTITALNELLLSILQGFENGEYVACTICDLTKAFDCVNHQLLLRKLAAYGICENALNLLKSYLSHRRQVVTYGARQSVEREVECGVPQGSVLGPFLFLVYINDLPEFVGSTKFVIFADDTTYMQSGRVLDDVLREIDSVSEKVNYWFRANKLTINPMKTKTQVFSLRILPEGDAQDPVRFLGVLIDQKLTWDRHIDKLCDQLSKYVYLFRSLRYEVSPCVLKSSYHGLFESRVRYAVLAWGHSSHLHRVFKVQRKIVRVIANLHYREDVKRWFSELSILTVPCIYIYECLRYIHSNTSSYSTAHEIHNYNTRRGHELNTMYVRLEKSKNALNFFGPKFYNILPANIKSLSPKLFNNAVRDLLIRRAFFTFEEYLSYVSS